MFNQDFINIFGEMTIQNWLLIDRKTLKNTYENLINYPNKPQNKEEICRVIAFENYCLKYADHTKTKLEQNIIDNLLDYLYKHYIINPSGLYNSMFFKDINIPKFFPSDKVSKIKKAKEKYREKAKLIMVKHAKNKNITEDEITNLMHFYIENINTKNKQLQNIIKEYITEILNDNISSNKNVLLFLGDFASRYMIDLYNEENKKEVPYPCLFITKEKSSNGGLLKNYIFINQKSPFCQTIPNFLQAVFHECWHAIQNYNSYHDKNSITSLEWTQNELFLMYVKNNNIQNHYLLDIERDAEKEGFNYAKLFYLCYGKKGQDSKGLAKLFREENKLNREKNSPFDYRIDETPIPKEYYNVKHMNEIIYKHPRLLRKYPVLNNLYEKNGNPKQVEYFLKDYGTTKTIKNNLIYTDYIIDSIFKDKLLSIKINNYTQKAQSNIFSNLIYILIKEFEKIEEMINYLTNNQIDLNQHNVLVIGNYHITIIIKIFDFLKRNHKLFKKLEDDGALNMDYYNSYTIKNAITSFNDFLKTVKVDTILDDGIKILEKSIQKYKKELTY